MTAVQTVSKAIPGILSKAAGVAGLGVILYDAHEAGKEHSLMYEKKVRTEALESRFIDTLKLNTPSVVRDTVKKKIFFFDMDNNIPKFFRSIKGYGVGLNEMLLNDVVPLGLSVGAILTKGILSKACGVGLLAYGLGFAAQEIFRIGKK